MSPSSSTLQTLFAQFQTRYPMASLISEFLTVHDGMYAVRAIAQIGNTVLATGMAAHPDLEAAEDRAKVRALEALVMPTTSAPLAPEPSSLRPTSWSSPLESVPQPSLSQRSPESLASTNSTANDLTTRDLIANLSLDSASPSSNPISEIPVSAVSPLPAWTPSTQSLPQIDAEVSNAGITKPVADSTVVDSVVADFYSHINADSDEVPNIGDRPTIDEVAQKNDDFPAAALSRASDLPINGKPRRKPAPSPESTAPAPVSVDLSDVIAQTDVELARLGWNKVQGREHLKRTYGKRSRQELNETELYDFLHYLQAQ